jgi:hypothetical protein
VLIRYPFYFFLSLVQGLPVYQKLGFEVVDEIVIETSAGSTVAAPTCIRHPVKKA